MFGANDAQRHDGDPTGLQELAMNAKSTNTARNRAEDLLQNLQKRARDWVDAEEGLVQTLREAADSGFSTAEAQKRLEAVLGRIRANTIWSRLRENERVVALSDYRGDVERRLEDAISSLVGTLPVASKNDLASMNKQIKALNRKVNDLARKVKELEGTPESSS
jgi:polyhydroxyalkanoate synthesis regulator phasin